jgi:hypothetical protein
VHLKEKRKGKKEAVSPSSSDHQTRETWGKENGSFPL